MVMMIKAHTGMTSAAWLYAELWPTMVQEVKQASQRAQAFQGAQAEAEAALERLHHSKTSLSSEVSSLHAQIEALQTEHRACQQVRFVLPSLTSLCLHDLAGTFQQPRCTFACRHIIGCIL